MKLFVFIQNDQGKINTGSTLILSGFGVGLSYGTILMDY